MRSVIQEREWCPTDPFEYLPSMLNNGVSPLGVVVEYGRTGSAGGRHIFIAFCCC